MGLHDGPSGRAEVDWVDLNKLSRGEQIAGGSAVVLLILSFLGFWGKYEAGGFTYRINAWSGYFNFLTKLGLIAAILVVILMILRLTDTDLNLPWATGMILLVLCAIVVLSMVITLITGPQEFGVGEEVSRGPLLFVGTLLALAMGYGGWLAYQEDTTATTTRTTTPSAGPPPGPPPPAS